VGVTNCFANDETMKNKPDKEQKQQTSYFCKERWVFFFSGTTFLIKLNGLKVKRTC